MEQGSLQPLHLPTSDDSPEVDIRKERGRDMRGEEFVGKLRKVLPRPESIRPINIGVEFHRFATQDVGRITVNVENMDTLAVHLSEFTKQRKLDTKLLSVNHCLAEFRFGLDKIGWDDIDVLSLALRKFIREQFGKGD